MADLQAWTRDELIEQIRGSWQMRELMRMGGSFLVRAPVEGGVLSVHVMLSGMPMEKKHIASARQWLELGVALYDGSGDYLPKVAQGKDEG